MKEFIKFHKGKAGKNAYMVSKVWKLGFHIFLNGEDIVFRFCYFRNKKGTHYIQFAKQIRKGLECGAE